jgi:hypothetical protein
MEKELARQKVELTGKRHREAFCTFQKATVIFKRDQTNRRACEVYTSALNAWQVAGTASWVAITDQNELYLHSVTEAGTQTDGTGITG